MTYGTTSAAIPPIVSGCFIEKSSSIKFATMSSPIIGIDPTRLAGACFTAYSGIIFSSLPNIRPTTFTLSAANVAAPCPVLKNILATSDPKADIVLPSSCSS